MGTFNEFLQGNKDDEKNKTVKQDIDELIDKYSTYSHDDLMNEFLQESERKKQNGELDENQLNKIKNIFRT